MTERDILQIARASTSGHLNDGPRRAEITDIARALEARGLLRMAPEGDLYRIFLTDRGRAELCS